MRLYDAFVLFCPFFNFNILLKFVCKNKTNQQKKNTDLGQLESE